jgi:hypothetical protein
MSGWTIRRSVLWFNPPASITSNDVITNAALAYDYGGADPIS